MLPAVTVTVDPIKEDLGRVIEDGGKAEDWVGEASGEAIGEETV